MLFKDLPLIFTYITFFKLLWNKKKPILGGIFYFSFGLTGRFLPLFGPN